MSKPRKWWIRVSPVFGQTEDVIGDVYCGPLSNDLIGVVEASRCDALETKVKDLETERDLAQSQLSHHSQAAEMYAKEREISSLLTETLLWYANHGSEDSQWRIAKMYTPAENALTQAEVLRRSPPCNCAALLETHGPILCDACKERGLSDE